MINLGALSSDGGFTFNNAGALNVTGAVSDASALASVQATGGTLAVTGTGRVAVASLLVMASGRTSDVTLAGAVNARGATATLSAGELISQTSAGLINAGTLTGSAVTDRKSGE